MASHASLHMCFPSIFLNDNIAITKSRCSFHVKFTILELSRMTKMSIVRYQTREYVGVHSRMLLWLFQVTFGYFMHQQRRRKHQQHDRSPSYAQHTHVWNEDVMHTEICAINDFSVVYR